MYILSFCLLCYLQKNIIFLFVYFFQLDAKKIFYFFIVGKSFDSVVRLKFIFCLCCMLLVRISLIFERFLSKDIPQLVQMFSLFISVD